jgi:hypothetical protein
VLEQPAEAVVGPAGRVVLAGGLGLGGGGAANRGDGVGRAGGFWSVKVSGAQARRRCQVR